MKRSVLYFVLLLIAAGFVKWLSAPSPAAALPAVIASAKQPVIASRAPVHVMAFGAKWCGPCHRDQPKREQLARRVKVSYVDVDNDPSGAASQFRITSLPTYLVFANGVGGYEVQLRTHSIDEVFKFLGL